MPQPLSLDDIANEMRDRQAHPNSNSNSQMVWDSENGTFVKLRPGETPKSNQTPMGKFAREPYFSK